MGIDVHRPSHTKLGTYLHAFLSHEKVSEDKEVSTLKVISAMIDVGES